MMNKSKKPKKALFSALCALILLTSVLPASAASFQARQEMPNTVFINDAGGSLPEDPTLPDDVRPEEVPGQVAGVSDEAPDGTSIFWGIVISLLVAGAVVVGIVMLVPKEGEEN